MAKELHGEVFVLTPTNAMTEASKTLGGTGPDGRMLPGIKNDQYLLPVQMIAKRYSV